MVSYEYVLGGILASLLGSVFFMIIITTLGEKKQTKASNKGVNSNNGFGNGAFQPEMEEEKSTDVVIVGAGVAGAALAYTLAKEGRRVHVIERDLTEPDRIVGELLQPGGYLKLIELGLEDCANESIDAQKVFGYALYKDGKDTTISYPLEKYSSDVAGRSFHNGRFIQRMREKATTLSNVKLEQGTVTTLIEEKGTIKGVIYKNKAGEEMRTYAPLTIVCDGCFSNLRRNLSAPKVESPSCFVGLILENCDLPHANHGHVILGDPSPILFYPISSTEVRCLVDIPGTKVPSVANGDMANYLKTKVAPQIPPELCSAFMVAIEKGKFRSMQNKSMAANPLPTPGAILLGDSFNMRHPLTGGGMTVALSDIVLIRDLLRPLHDLNDAPALCNYLESFYTLRKPVSSTINTLAGALYKVFCASPDPARQEMREACFDYLSLGGICSYGPVSLLSGLNPRPLHLLLHFFAVAIYGVGRLMLPFPSPQRMWLGARLILVESPSCFVGLILENCDLPHANHGHVILGDPSPILFYPISSTEVRCLVDIPGTKVPSVANGDMANYLKTKVAPQIPPELCSAFMVAIEKGKFRSMQNKSMAANPLPTPGAILLGDSFNMRHPLTGGGMTVALSDIVLIRDLLRPLHDLNDAPALCNYLESFYTLRKPVSSTINTLAGALYKVFCASPDPARQEMREACFDYLSLGGICSYGPVSLLSGLNPRPLHLLLHFFAVAIYGVGRLMLPFPSPQRMWLGARLILSASGIIFPIIKGEGVRQMFFPATVSAYYRSPPLN